MATGKVGVGHGALVNATKAHQTGSESVRGKLESLVGALEGSSKSWDSQSGNSFALAKQELFNKFDALMVTINGFGHGMATGQKTVTTSDDEMDSSVVTAKNGVSALNPTITVNA